ncbi:MAG TPA: DNA internalization-related competence protein ComEC/Rec2 [Candidatus Marinimicrobia bacterium]|nr:DNA internalization-related competence protein ComEC/Rec2 [Candidatus Neomarinimicrobiota bacterium]
MSSLIRFVQRYPVFKFLPIQILGIFIGTHYTFPSTFLLIFSGVLFLIMFTRYFQITLPIIVLLMPILVLQTGNSHNISDFPSGEVLIQATVSDIQKKRNSDYIILDAGDKRVLLQTSDSLNILPADTIILRGELKMPQPPRNHGEFNYGSYLRSQGIQAVIHRNFSVIAIIEGEPSVKRWFFEMRQGIHQRLTEAVGHPYDGLASGLLLGEKSGIEPKMKEQFRRLGIIHILAVSGLHVGFVLLVLTVIAKIAVFSRLNRFLFISAGLLFYLGISGGAISVMRAVTMAILYVYGNLREKEIIPWSIVGFTAFIFLLVDPPQLFSLSFQLSFGAVFGILFLLAQFKQLTANNEWLVSLRKYRSLRWLMDALVVSFGAQLGTFLPIAITFGEIPVWAFVANLVIIPLAGLSVITSLIISLLMPFSAQFGIFYGEALWGQLFLMDKLAMLLNEFPYQLISFQGWDKPSLFVLFVGMIFLATVSQVKYRFRAFVICLLLGNFFIWKENLNSPKLIVTFLDVGQGDACVIEDGEHTILVDAGYAGFGKDYGKKTVVPFLKYKGISEINLAVMTHPHADHIGGLESVLKNFPINEIWDTHNDFESSIYKRILKGSEENKNTIQYPQPGNIYQLGEMKLTVLFPDSLIADKMENINNASIVFRLDYYNYSFLFTGDAEIQAERILSNLDSLLQADVVKVGHHGSSTSSIGSMVKHVSPEFAVISVGKNNRYGHPSKKIVQRWVDSGTEVFRTDESGAVIFKIDSKGINIQTLVKRDTM